MNKGEGKRSNDNHYHSFYCCSGFYYLELVCNKVPVGFIQLNKMNNRVMEVKRR